MRLHQHLRREQGRHTDDWLITYADTITLLLCLFVVILSIRTTARHPAPEPAAAIVQSTPVSFFNGEPPFHALTPITEPAANEAPPEPIAEPSEREPRPPRWIDAAAEPTPPSRPLPRPDPPRPAPTSAVEPGGDRITTLQISSAAFFGSGNATLSGAGKAILADVAVTLKSPRLAAYRIAIEGHTDDMPINTPQFQSNWELSTARAAAVVRFLLEQGIPAGKLTAAGYADTFPIAPNRNADGTVIPENQASNRRVVIRLEKIDKAAR